MQVINIPSGQICVVEVPKGAKSWTIVYNHIHFRFIKSGVMSLLPFGSWTSPVLLSEVTEEMAKGMVEFNGANGFYKAYNSETGYIWNTALESLHSLLRSHSIDPNKNLLILTERK